MADTVHFRASAQIRLVAFNLSEATAATAFGEIGNNFTGTITIGTRYMNWTLAQTTSHYQINRHKNFDNDGDYCFQLTPAAILNANYLYSIKLCPQSLRGEFYVQPQSVGGVTLTPYRASSGNYPNQRDKVTCFSALQYEKV